MRSFAVRQCPAAVFSLIPLSWVPTLLAAGLLTPGARSGQSAPDSPDIPSRPLSAKEKQKKEENLRKQPPGSWRSWLNEDVVYIVTDGERRAFRSLQTDEERQSFLEQFWLRRNSAPDSLENPFEEEHYRRIAYSNVRFGTAIPGWRTDRGRIYIVYGPPDEMEVHPGKAGDQESDCPWELWRYRYIEGIGHDVRIRFVDTTRSGEYHMTIDPSAFPTPATEPMAESFAPAPATHLPLPQDLSVAENIIEILKPPRVKFRNLEEVISTNIRYSTLPMKVQADCIRVTDATVLTPITVLFAKRDLQYKTEDHHARAIVNIFGRVTSASRRVIASFEDVVTVETAADPLNKTTTGSACYQKILPLAPGTYSLSIVARDVVGATTTNYEMALNVPRFEAEKLSSSSLILADLRDKDRTRNFGALSGDEVIQPRMGAFSNNERLGVYLQLYNFAPGPEGGKPEGSIEYLVTRAGTKESLIDLTEDLASLPGTSASQVTVEKVLPLNTLAPGQYTIQLKVTDRIGNQTLAPRATLTVTEARTASDSTISYGNPVPVPHVSLTATGAGLRMRTVFQRIRVV